MPIGPTDGNRPFDGVIQGQTSSTNTSGSQNRAADKGIPLSAYEDPRNISSIVQHEYRGNSKISTIQYPAGTVPVNTRKSSKEGARLDNNLRRSQNYLQERGLAPSHAQGLQFGAHPGDPENVDPASTQQNAGNWKKAEQEDIELIKKHSQVDRERVVETGYRPDGRVLYRKSTVTANGSIVNHGPDVLFGEFPTSASRTAAANGGLEPGEGRQLDKAERDRWKAQKGNLDARQPSRDQWINLKSTYQNRASMTPAEQAEYRRQADNLLIQGGPQKPEPSTTPRQSSTGTSVLSKVGKVAGHAALVAPTIIEAASDGIEAYKDGKGVAGVAGATAAGAGNGILDTFAPGARSGYSDVIGEGDLTGLDRMLNGVDHASGTATAVGGAAMLAEAAGVVTLPAEIPTAIATGVAGATNLAVNVAKASVKVTGLAGKDQDGGWIYNGVAAGSRAVSYVAERGIERAMHLWQQYGPGHDPEPGR